MTLVSVGRICFDPEKKTAEIKMRERNSFSKNEIIKK